MQNWHNPVLVRKHFDSEKQAKEFKIKYGNRHFEVTSGKIALNMYLMPWHNYTRNHRHSIAKLSKYEFPPHVKTQYQKQIFRDAKRRKLKRKKYRPMLTYKLLKEILDQKEMLFFKRLSNYRSYYKAYSEPVGGFKVFLKEYEYPFDIVHLSAIYKCLEKYYDLGIHNRAEVSLFIYEFFKEKVHKWRGGPDMSHKEEEEVKAEFLARGFIIKQGCDMGEDDVFVETVYIKPTLVFPEIAWFQHVDEGVYDHSVYDLLWLVGIQGYIRAHTGTD